MAPTTPVKSGQAAYKAPPLNRPATLIVPAEWYYFDLASAEADFGTDDITLKYVENVERFKEAWIVISGLAQPNNNIKFSISTTINGTTWQKPLSPGGNTNWYYTKDAPIVSTGGIVGGCGYTNITGTVYYTAARHQGILIPPAKHIAILKSGDIETLTSIGLVLR